MRRRRAEPWVIQLRAFWEEKPSPSSQTWALFSSLQTRPLDLAGPGAQDLSLLPLRVLSDGPSEYRFLGIVDSPIAFKFFSSHSHCGKKSIGDFKSAVLYFSRSDCFWSPLYFVLCI